ncbi:hypothetical protein NBRC10512v2_000631 [Rhodotorula toruloides]|uniref:Uncharacterized protein n=1 Tax=Rhodotorula toruloides (strain NP11) TaxID=1130832 RepID=M7WZY1_RHOT1|nr:uncharacterized protein RHTO_07139 [Rhodotorula toruloides NP11]EMS23405.1 hypothetical protein RHTO_07139 [Rhodotorula toruloides NP11]
MARTHSQYPRSTLRTILRSHASSSSAHTLSPNSDAIAFVAHLAFLRKLAREVKELVEEEKGRKEKKRVEAADLRRASKPCSCHRGVTDLRRALAAAPSAERTVKTDALEGLSALGDEQSQGQADRAVQSCVDAVNRRPLGSISVSGLGNAALDGRVRASRPTIPASSLRRSEALATFNKPL